MTTLTAERISVAYEGRAVIEELSLHLPDGRVTAVIGANGCGKSTLLRTLARLLPTTSGRVLVDATDAASFRPREFARRVGLLPQSPVAPEGILVADLVGRGRSPHQGRFGRWRAGDYAAVADALEMTGLTELAQRPVNELSGGQRQRAWIAMVLAQQTDVLLLDEPTTYLDVTTQLEILELLGDLNRRLGTTVVMVLHDMNLAARYSDHLVAMRAGAILAEGTPEEVVTADTLAEVFDLDAQILTDPLTRRPLVAPIGRRTPTTTKPTTTKAEPQ
ncbi:ABC transporter ATP-binding protein [Corynebacterium guangdongense]|uniref:Iron complex transport system ATP-binding protein n=1 Tax=Corynebacterium guangdongense TaxID=1783348 RepID=A0ABU1ZUM2_9CORY|nr:ABC transporter ATP-binding protein [Corynebacterium guangdongense]MDR7328624.1 iron complex transport system ATP-binding protein [Corynebacterium guangdongense]WJZ17201.1 putative siderophore transport system ATP-binding protein YusV [Corynebacterium guangdongense]